MAVIGNVRQSIQVKLFDHNVTQDWDVDFSPSVLFYAGQGFNVPTDPTWANRPTGTQSSGMVMGFPRSVELPPVVLVGLWYIQES